MSDKKTKKVSGAPDCGLYLRVGGSYAMLESTEDVMKDLKEIFFTIKHSHYEKNFHVLEVPHMPEIDDFVNKAKALCLFARQSGIVALMRGNDAALAQSVEADGIIVTDWDHYAKAREIFGPDGIVGLVCENEPQHAADAFDLEADFISIGMKKGGLPSTEALKFWSILSDSPALIEGAVTNDYAAYYVEAGAGFIDASDYIFNHPEGVMKGTVNMMYAIDLALASRTNVPKGQVLVVDADEDEGEKTSANKTNRTIQ